VLKVENFNTLTLKKPNLEEKPGAIDRDAYKKLGGGRGTPTKATTGRKTLIRS